MRRNSLPRRGASALDDRALRHNLSFVLHEHSESAAVHETADSCRAHARALAKASADISRTVGSVTDRNSVVGVEEFLAQPVGTLLTATLGSPQLLGQFARLHADRPHVLFADRGVSDGADVKFFRAPARLALPGLLADRLLIAAVVLRPSVTSAEFRWSGPFRWPADHDQALRALESLIQPFAGQWMPPEPLWSAPAEQLLRDEIRSRE